MAAVGGCIEANCHQRNVVATIATIAMRSHLDHAEKTRLAALNLDQLVDAEEASRLFPLLFRMGDALSLC